jgi:hypothetical protein
MGVDAQALRLFCEWQERQISFTSTMMIGRQNFSAELNADDLRGLGIANQEASDILKQGYIEPLLRRLGAQRVESIDQSDYEHASIIHDLNEPIPESLKKSFSCVFDGGTLEHVFNFPLAIKNCMEMVAVGGHFLGITCANNFTGHGFYQFSPELFYRVFSPENGYIVEDMLLCQTHRGGRATRLRIRQWRATASS